MALATVLTATSLTGIAAAGGLAHWHAQQTAVPAAIAQPSVPPAPIEVDE